MPKKGINHCERTVVQPPLLFRETGLVDRSDLVRILLLGKTQKKVAIIKKRTTGHDRVSLLLRQRINPSATYFPRYFTTDIRGTGAEACGQGEKTTSAEIATGAGHRALYVQLIRIPDKSRTARHVVFLLFFSGAIY